MTAMRLTAMRLVPYGFCCIVLLAASGAAWSAPAFTVTEVVTPSLGQFWGGPAGRQFVLNTDGTITGANAADYLGGAVAGEVRLRIASQGGFPANIVADNVSTLGGLSVGAVLCQYHNQPQTICGPPGMNVTVRGNRILALGVDVTTTQFHNDGDVASVTLDITLTFL